MKNKKSASFQRILYSLAAGMFCGLVVHYLLYRFLLPVKPFVYVAF